MKNVVLNIKNAKQKQFH